MYVAFRRSYKIGLYRLASITGPLTLIFFLEDWGLIIGGRQPSTLQLRDKNCSIKANILTSKGRDVGITMYRYYWKKDKMY